MGRFSDTQSRFSGGEWSGKMAGRIDDPRYRTGLKLSLNYCVGEEESLIRRSGSHLLGYTKDGNAGRVMDWKFTATAPYLSEFTDSFMRVWNASTLTWVFDDQAGITAISTANPTVITVSVALGANWATGDYGLISFPQNDTTSMQRAPALVQRAVKITRVDSTHLSLADAVTGAAISGASFSGSFNAATISHIFQAASPYVGSAWRNLRKVQVSDSEQNPYGTAGIILQRVIFLHGSYQPRSIRSNSTFQLVTEDFKDGPYVDLPDVQLPITPSGTHGSIDLVIDYDWSASVAYAFGQAIKETGQFFVSTIDDNLANDPGTPGDPVNWIPLQAWSSGTTYGFNQCVLVNSTIYYSVQASNTNHSPATSPHFWQTTPLSFQTSQAGRFALLNGKIYFAVNAVVAGPPGADWVVIDPQVAINTYIGPDASQAFQPTDVGRLIRLFDSKGAALWSSTVSYSSGDSVVYQGNVFKATAASSAGTQPDVSPDIWSIDPDGVRWTWGRITAISMDLTTATIDLKGNQLRGTDAIVQWRFGLYSDTTSWPTCGAWHEGRLWLASAIFPNRFDASTTNDPFNFAPTEVDGTVDDANAISEVLNAEDVETILWLRSSDDGIVMGTESGEWLISASALDDPISPFSIQARKKTFFGSANIEPVRLPSALAVVQGLGRRIFEYKNWVDASAYSVAKNGVNLLKNSSHLSRNAVAELAFVSDPLPNIYARDEVGGIFCIGYKRDPDQQYIAPASMSLGTGRLVTSIASQLGADGISSVCWMVTSDTTDTPKYTVEVLQPPWDTNNQYDEWFLDWGVQPFAFIPLNTNTQVKLFGLYLLAGLTITVSVGGNDLGEWTVAADGTLTITLATAGVTIDTWEGAQPPATIDVPTPALRGVCGYVYNSDGQRLRPVDGGQNGPPTGKTRRFERMAMQFYQAHEIKIGTDFTTLYPIKMTEGNRVSPLGLNELAEGVFRDSVQNDYTYDGQLCWRQTRPYPGVILGVSGFGTVNDV